MLFHSTQFIIFFLVVLALHYTLPRPFRRWLLLIASYYFYMCWNPRFIALLLTLTIVDYLAAIGIARFESTRRTAALWLSLGANLLFLGYFKYFNFFAASLAQLLHQSFAPWDIILPLGISFHTFQSISYVVDVYRRQQEPVRDPIDYALFIAFFPQLVAGPIVRAREFFADYYNWRPPTAAMLQNGILMILAGYVKKMVLADQFAQIANIYFKDVTAHPGLLPAWGGVIAFSFQIFFDFSGYTDIAIGCAATLGFSFPENFRRPYLAQSITEFWRRWHMSLSRWLRDYLYITLGGNRHGSLNTYRNLILTMLLGGLWHGASWNFIIWGGYHGALLSMERIAGVDPQAKRNWVAAIPRVLVTFTLVAIGWVFFRAESLHDAWFVITQMVTPSLGGFPFSPWMSGMALGAVLIAIVEERYGLVERLSRAGILVFSFTVGLLLIVLEMFAVTDVSIPFVYFQF